MCKKCDASTAMQGQYCKSTATITQHIVQPNNVWWVHDGVTTIQGQKTNEFRLCQNNYNKNEPIHVNGYCSSAEIQST